MSEPRWFEGAKGDVLAVECALCASHPGCRWPWDYSHKNEACPSCKGAAWIVLKTFEAIPPEPPQETAALPVEEER